MREAIRIKKYKHIDKGFTQEELETMERFKWNEYASVLTVVILATLQAVVVMVQKHLARQKKRRAGALVVGIPFHEWLDDSVWDDVACSIACAAMMAGLCHLGFSDWTWIVLAPMFVVGSMTTAYHFIEESINQWKQKKKKK